MKKLLFTALVAVSLISSAFAAPVSKVNYMISNAFHAGFPKADNVAWDITTDYAKATFVLDDVKTEAFYNLNGDLMGTSQSVTIASLPTRTKRMFAKKYGSYTVREAIKFDGADETAYYISAENETQSLILKVTENTIETFKAAKK